MTKVAISRDGEAILLLCSWLGLPKEADGPLSQTEWNCLAQAIARSPLERPAAILGMDAGSLAADLGIPENLSERVERLLARTGPLAIELERLSSIGIWATTRADETYPGRLKAVLGAKAPPCLFAAGEPELLNLDGFAIVGSREIDEAGKEFADSVGRRCASSGLAVISGGARGTDRYGMAGALDADGQAVGILADSLERTIASRDVRQWIVAGQLTLISHLHPKAPFTVGNAMQRNKLIYAMALAALVVSSDLDKGGTWTGALEDLRAGWAPLYVRDGDDVPPGNRGLLKRGALPFPEDADLRDLFSPVETEPVGAVQGSLFELQGG
jgi:DNA processing protein